MRAYHQTCAEVMHRFDGYIAQYLGDGGWRILAIPWRMRTTPSGLSARGSAYWTLSTRSIPSWPCPRGAVAVRLGVHTGLVVVGDVGEGARQEPLALGETPNIAARLQQLAAPNTLVISAATYHLIEGYFTCEALGEQPLRGRAQPLRVYRVCRPVGSRVAWRSPRPAA